MAEEIISMGGPSGPAQPDADAEPGEGAGEHEVRTSTVGSGMHGWRLDRALVALAPEFSRSYLQQLLAEGAIRHRGALARKAAQKVVAGDVVQVELRPTPQAMAFVAQPIPLDIVYEDADLLVIDKPAGLVVHPAAGHWSGTLLNGLLAHHAGAAGLPRAGIVHRLDKDTSGLMLVGKSRRAVDALVRAIAARDVHREYLAIAHGAWRGPSPLHIDRPVGRDPVHRLRMAVLRDEQTGARAAQTTVSLLGTTEEAALVACKLHTGRTHQIRVHMAAQGHPLVGDALYGGRERWGMQRQALHATRLRLAHPVDGTPLVFVRRPPQDFMSAMVEAGLRYNDELSGAGS